MFENLLESRRIRETSKTWKYFLITAAVWLITLAGIVVAGVYFYSAHLDDEMTAVTMLAPTPSIVRRSEGVVRGMAISKPVPEYPAVAKNSKVSGDVQIEITIGEDGSVVQAHVVSGPPLLQASALEAARSWKFKPTMLNG